MGEQSFAGAKRRQRGNDNGTLAQSYRETSRKPVYKPDAAAKFVLARNFSHSIDDSA
ncbi:MAG: hypothetical protein KJ787_13220 [Gammaproteobacteria bacterium]|nr:hypothetical protein [Gammaproteobacteria bacterium]MBU1647285.1 hypothetical protein [Gammaproteobacteria bacterium]MBU1972797.1 hypothetical protein [Gammaproteobacteria bacterium]